MHDPTYRITHNTAFVTHTRGALAGTRNNILKIEMSFVAYLGLKSRL